MHFYAEITIDDDIHTDRLDGISDLAAAKADTLLTMTEIIRTGFDGCGRTVSARISDEEHVLLSAMSLALAVQDA